VLKRGESRPHRLRTSLPDESLEPLQDLLHRSPREFGLDRSLWTLPLAARISFEQGLIAVPTSGQSLRRVLKRLGTSWKRAKHADH
jgi:transposase